MMSTSALLRVVQNSPYPGTEFGVLNLYESEDLLRIQFFDSGKEHRYFGKLGNVVLP